MIERLALIGLLIAVLGFFLIIPLGFFNLDISIAIVVALSGAFLSIGAMLYDLVFS